jgi:hypothetical protein
MEQIDHDLLTRIDERTQNIEMLLQKHVSDDEKIQGDHEKRIRWNERFRNWCLGVLAAGGGGWGGFEFFK